MKVIIATILASLWVSSALGATVRIVGKNNLLLFQGDSKTSAPVSVGDLTVAALEKNKIPFEGGAYGISKIYHLGQDIEIISDIEMKAYGWCFSVDGFVPETMPDETLVLNPESVIEWYYAYAHYLKGNWIGQCVRD